MNFIFFSVIAILSIPPFIPNNSIVGSFTIGDLLFLMISPVIIIRSNYKIIFNKINILIFLIGIISIVSSLNSHINLQISDLNLSNILYSFRWFYFAFLSSLLSCISINKEFQETILKGIIAGSLFTLLITIYIWFQFPVYAPLSNIPMLHIIYEEGFKINRNYLGFVLSIGAAISYGMIYVESKIKARIIYLIISVILTIGLLLTFSKGSWLSIFALILISFFRNIKKYRTYLISFIIFISSIFLTRFDLFAPIIRRLNNSDAYNEIRFQMLKDSIKMTMLHPILGVGPQAYKSTAISLDFLPTVDPHNAFTWISSELGLIPLFLLLIVTYQTFKNIYMLRKFNIEPLTIPLINVGIILLIHSFLSGLTFSSRYFWLILGLTEGIIIYRKRLFNGDIDLKSSILERT